jgi:hypothetical protein
MLMPLLMMIACVALSCAVSFYLLTRTHLNRLEVLERDLQTFSDAMCQMAEMQIRGFQKLNGNVGEIEERILELAVPPRDSSRTLERRHQVLALSRKGVAVDEIVKRLNLPRGEAELILSLQKFTDVATTTAAGSNGESNRYVQD